MQRVGRSFAPYPPLSRSPCTMLLRLLTNLCLPWLVALTMSTYLFVWFTDCCHRIVLPFQQAGTFDANFSGQAAAVLRHEKAPCLPIFSWSTAQGLLQLKKSSILVVFKEPKETYYLYMTPNKYIIFYKSPTTKKNKL